MAGGAEAPAVDLTPYVPRLLLEWEEQHPDVRYRAIDGTLVFADVSGFTKLSERLARAGGKIGAEQMTEVINGLFGELLLVAAARGGEMLKYGGDAVLVFFAGEHHGPRGVAACFEMQRKLREIGRVDTGAGAVRLRMSVGVNSGTFDFFKVGASHEELVVAGPATTACVEMEAAADATEVLVAPATAELLAPQTLGDHKAGGRLLRRLPSAPVVDFAPLVTDVDAGRFVPTALRSHLSGGRPDPDHRLATVAFLHLMGLDGVLHAEGPEVATERLDTTLRAVQDAFERHGISFLATDLAPDGTKVMAAAGAPAAVEDAAGRMLRALLEVAAVEGGLPVRSGANAGHVFSGDVGPSFRRTYTTIGDVTNTAARVMGKAAAGEVLALASVTRLAADAVDVVPQPSFLAKGKREPLEPLLVRALTKGKGDRAPDDFVGRAAELDILVGVLRAATAGRGSVITVTSDPGMGKTRLVEEALRSAPAASEIRVACDRYSSSVPYAATVQLLHRIVDGRTVSDWIDRHAPDLAPWVPIVADLLGEESTGTVETDEIDPGNLPATRARVVADVFARWCEGPSALVVDDAHLMDEASSAVFDQIAATTDDAPTAVVVARRPADTGWQPARGEELALGPLADDAVIGLARARSGNLFLPHELAELAARAQGNPLFVEQLAAAGTRSDGFGDLPDSVEELLCARIDALPQGERNALRAAAVVGVEFEPALVAAALGAEEVALPWDDLEPFVEPAASDGSLQFRSPLVRDVAYDGLPFRRRRDLHLRVGQLLEDRDVRPGLLCVHFSRAGDDARTWRYGFEAGEAAKEEQAPVEAATFLRRAVEAAARAGAPAEEQARAWRGLGEVLLTSGHLAEALVAFRRARRLTGDPVDQALILKFEGMCHEQAGRYRAALGRYRSATELLLEHHEQSPQLAVLRTAVGLVRFRQGRLVQAEQELLQAIPEAEATGDLLAIGTANHALFMTQTRLRRAGRDAYAARAVEAFRELRDLRLVGDVLNELGNDALLDERWDEALADYAEAADAYARAGDLSSAIVRNNIGEIEIERRQVRAAVANLREAVATFEAAGSQFAVAARMNLGLATALDGDLEHGLGLLDRSLRELEAMGAGEWVAECLARRAQAEVAAGLFDRAAATLRELRRRRPDDPLALRLRGEVLVHGGQVEEGRSLLEEAVVAAGPGTYQAAMAARVLAALLARTGETSRAEELEREASSTLRRLNVDETWRWSGAADVVAAP